MNQEMLYHQENIWFRSTVGTNVPVWEDRGTLRIMRGQFRFDGKWRMVAGRAEAVHRVQMGTNRWAAVLFRDPSGNQGQAYFFDGSALGWGGVLGGTKRIFNCLQASRSQ